MQLTSDQSTALAEITAALHPGNRHLLTGYAGSGKTTLMHAIPPALPKRRKIVFTAPTHKAVQVLRRKSAGLNVECQTIHSLLSLKPKVQRDRTIFVRRPKAPPVMADYVVIDEASMVSEDLIEHIEKHLGHAAVLYVGDPAQLPPVGERESRAFQTKSRSHLDTIVRQAAGNPVLDAAHVIRASQGGPADWSWVKPSRAGDQGVFMPSDPGAWLHKAFTSSDFKSDPDSYRYVAWTNDRVAAVNQKIRRAIFGRDPETPFLPGERALFRAPVIDGDRIVFTTNEEAEVVSCAPGAHTFEFPACNGYPEWQAVVPTWETICIADDKSEYLTHPPRDLDAMRAHLDRAMMEAREDRDRWEHVATFKQAYATMQPIYALTLHCSQGSTFRYCFIDLPDIRRRERTNLLEMQQLFYVGATRPSHGLVLCT